MALSTVLLMSLGWTAMLHEGIGLPVIGRSISNEPEPGHRQRAKRCSCNNQLDTECHYFCHLDIIWVNTPSKTTIYGLGSPMARRRRSTDRCACATTADQTCKSFCIHSLKNGAVHQNSISMWKNLEHLRPDLNDADPENVVTEETEDEFQDDVLTFIRNLMRAKAAMKLVASAKQKNLLSHKTGYR